MHYATKYFPYLLATTSDATGPGGNQKIGQHQYGTSPYGHLKVTKSGSKCTMDNSDVEVRDCNHGGAGSCGSQPIFSFDCPENTYKEINGGYSPLNDALYYGNSAFNMFLEWGKVRFVDKVKLNVHVDNDYENAFYASSLGGLFFGDGKTTFYPLSGDIGVMAHEIGHWFTQTQSGLVYREMSGGLNEAFSDMAAIAANFHALGRTQDFMVGPDIFKRRGAALRYMKNPPQDGRSIDKASDFQDGMDPHLSSGVFNKAFYLLATKSGWDVKKAFMAMAKANIKYWSRNTDWNSAGSGVIDAACDLGYSTDDVKDALAQVGISSQLSSGKQCVGKYNFISIHLITLNCLFNLDLFGQNVKYPKLRF